MADLKQQCAERKEERNVASLQKRLDSCKKKNTALTKQAINLRAAAERNLRAIRAVTEATDMDPDDHRLIRALDAEGIGFRDIAEKFETDILTVACVIEGVV